MSKILITGLTGFVGSWLAMLLYSKGYKVYGISLSNKNPLHIYNKCKISKISKSYLCDIKNYASLHKIFIKIKPDFVVHLAAQPLVFTSYHKPFDTFFTNIQGTLNVFALTKKYGSGKVINFTSDKVYENSNKNIAYKETDTLKGYDPYSLSKSCSDLIGQSLNLKYYDNHKMKISTIRSGNIIGGGDWSNYRLIPDYYSAFLKRKNLIIRQPLNIRPWQHVINPIAIIYQIINKSNLGFFDTFNIGPHNKNYNVKFVIDKLNTINRNKKVKITYLKNENLKESKNLKLNISKSKKKFKYPRSNINIDLIKTNEWYLNSFKKSDMSEITLQQINDYLN